MRESGCYDNALKGGGGREGGYQRNSWYLSVLLQRLMNMKSDGSFKK